MNRYKFDPKIGDIIVVYHINSPDIIMPGEVMSVKGVEIMHVMFMPRYWSKSYIGKHVAPIPTWTFHRSNSVNYLGNACLLDENGNIVDKKALYVATSSEIYEYSDLTLKGLLKMLDETLEELKGEL